jgi:hypothetical protein
MARLEEEEEPDFPIIPSKESIPEEQFLLGQAQALGTFRVVD